MSQQEKRVTVSLITSLILFVFFAFYMLSLHGQGLLVGPEGYSLIGKSFFALIGGGIVLSIVVQIVVTIVHSIVTKGYEPMMNDERDKLFSLKCMQIILMIFSVGFVASMAMLALEMVTPHIVFLLIIFSMFIANFIGDLVKLFLYRGGV